MPGRRRRSGPGGRPPDRVTARRRTALPGCLRRAARRRGGRAVAVADRADRGTRHRQNHHRRPTAGAAGRAGRTGRPAAASDRPGRPDRQGRRPVARGGAGRGRRIGSGRPRPAAGAGRHHAAPAAGWATGHLVAVPAQPGQPAPPRRDRRRRNLNGLADHDGPPAGGRAARFPAAVGRRPGPAGLGGGRRGAGRSGRRTRRGRRLPGGQLVHVTSIRGVHRSAGERDPRRRLRRRRRRPRRRWGACGVGGHRQSHRGVADNPCAACFAAAGGGGARRRRRVDRRTGGTPDAVRAPPRAIRGHPLEPADRTLAGRADRHAAVGRVVRRPTGPGDRK